VRGKFQIYLVRNNAPSVESLWVERLEFLTGFTKDDMETATFNKFREIVYEKSGISLGKGKEALVSARVGKRMRALEIEDYKAYLQYLLSDKSGDEIVQLIDAISTNVTSFFRESDHFEFIKPVVSEWLSQKQRRFRFWSAACSTGEEPYSLAMTLLETMKEHSKQTDIKILATDISTGVLGRCMAGTYTKEKLENVPSVYRKLYFDESLTDHGVSYTIKKALKDLIVFQRFNLIRQTFPMRGPFDMILCRNVMIYFDQVVRKNLIKNFHHLLRKGGYLIVGHAESLAGLEGGFRVVRPSIYVKHENGK